MPSPAFLIPLGVSAILGAIGGLAFQWVHTERAWELFTAAFLWTLISAAGTTIGRLVGERVRRNQWRRALWLAHVQSFPLTTVFLLVAIPFSRGAVLVPSVLPVLYGSTLAIALFMTVLGVVTARF
ncbi:hypothetical protein [Candidatus Viridilinea mediisalina]|uniref:Uncharacterized protein n=1 Tax=Candidatus Viridilinea mediisalina TaxID=2024553 RepID=A0A2A6RJB6_9CHLR|nr:hypothetical protein [Candidatus Viridilinea mediisalina]PDW03102.1 hypothetical protein CJ255_10665 [Candidatus Viridilinea mediisalina]